MSRPVQADIYIAMNEDGDYEVGVSEEEAKERLVDNIGGYQVRLVKIIAQMTPPEMAQVEVTVPDEAGTTTEAAVADEAA